MHLTLHRDRCGHQLPACEECFADFLRTGEVPARGCLGNVIDDGAPELVVKVLSGSHAGTLVITERNRDRIIYEGWTKFVRLAPRSNAASPQTRLESSQNDEPHTSA
ncbi:MAG: hypothetical protein HY741_10905 [Chloroflexi bacterium]|nr:hypothetical protein [Chloroflexota bacterium]